MHASADMGPATTPGTMDRLEQRVSVDTTASAGYQNQWLLDMSILLT
jgi:hypothetical protein